MTEMLDVMDGTQTHEEDNKTRDNVRDTSIALSDVLLHC